MSSFESVMTSSSYRANKLGRRTDRLQDGRTNEFRQRLKKWEKSWRWNRKKLTP